MEVVCDGHLNSIFYATKNIINLIMIIVPILEMITLVYLFVSMVNHPDDKKLLSKLKNSILALFIVFMIPTLVNAVMGLLGEKTTISSCWNQASKVNLSTTYIEDGSNSERKQMITDEKEYEKGVPKRLKFNCTSDIVKSQFSCETLKIVEKHLNDFNYYNFRSVIASYGGFDQYVQSLGGVFAKYYGKTTNAKTVYEFQLAAEYTFGFMYMYGMDYYNSGGEYQNWGTSLGGSGHSSDAFYPDNVRAEHWAYDFDSKFDEVISGANGRLWMATECGPSATAPLFKAGILKIGQPRNVTYITRLRDLKPGDVMYFFDAPVGDKTNRSTWGKGRHNVLIGEVYDDKIVIYDGGRNFQVTKNFKREIKRPQNDSEEYESIFGFGGWAAERFGNLK